jgi:hypothetical protein
MMACLMSAFRASPQLFMSQYLRQRRLIEFSTYRLETLLTTTKIMPFEWNAGAMIHDLPIIMVAVAHRFHYQSLRPKEGVPKNLSYMKRHNPVGFVTLQPRFDDLMSLARSDAPLAKHEDALEMYQLLCDHIKDVEDNMSDECGQCGPARGLMYKVLQEEMPGADGGVDQRRWWAYVECVIKAVFVWQAYCDRARRLMLQRIGQMNISTAGAEEGVQAYRIG